MANEYEKRALYGVPKVGGDILSYCSRCKIELAHVVVSMIDTKPSKVICKTCKSEHKHRRDPGSAPAAGLGSRTTTPRTRVPKTVVRIAEVWEKKVNENKAAVPKRYAVSGKFLKGDLLEHSKFGMGVVEEVRGDGKMSVLFRDGEKVLVHGLGA